MERSALLTALKSMMGEYMHDDDKGKLDTITDDTDFIKDLHMDSIDLVDMVIKTENMFGIEIKNETIAGLNTVGKCLDIVQDKLAEKQL
jgi:acyl carrier protein